MSNTTSSSSRSNEPAAGSVPEFIQKLFRMLENKAFRHTFCWGPDGTTFVVKDTNEFSKSILPKHFKHCNFASFVRQLNKYDFHKVRNADDGPKPYGEQAWEFVHPKFRRDRKDLLEEIRRKTPGKQKKEDSANKDSNASSSSSLAAANAATASAAANASATSINTNSNDMAIKLESDQNESISEFRQLTESLQARIDQLQRSQLEMEEKMTRLTRNDELVMTELQNFSKSMLAKDELLREVLDLVVKRDKGN
ncbi:hypothetical protein BCR43DRAFT_437591 [Syncephalastrum racemosum]|uniref:HSF-type DNA-binding domain-containing protein n=1 Tax=Syncephalastrum racemosum TaxID=13706 RepID=A0A1X2HHL5_SYNRA|nr:hypothetical protein BCR43DRAFT_437591 [Syncephalastrum racemosum]